MEGAVCLRDKLLEVGNQSENEHSNLASGSVHVDKHHIPAEVQKWYRLEASGSFTEHANLFLLFVFNHDQTTP